MTAPLRYLEFDCSEDTQGCSTFDAMASTEASHVAAVRAEIARVLDWAYAAFPDGQAPLDDGGEWDYDLHSQQEWTAPETLVYDENTHEFTDFMLEPSGPRHTVTLSVSGSPQFSEAFRAQFGVV